MSESTETVEAIEELEEAVLEIIDGAEVEQGLLGKVLRPNGTRDYPAGGFVTVQNPTAYSGKYRYRTGAAGQWVNRTIPAGGVQTYNALTAFYLKNIGTVDLNVTP